MLKLIYAPGDGIGPEIGSVALKILNYQLDKYGIEYSITPILFGGCAIDAYGTPLSDSDLALIKQSDAVLLGAVGGPKWDSVDASIRPEKGLLKLRKECAAFANFRPAKVYDCLKNASPLKRSIIDRGVDIMIVRELSGGIYFGERSEGDHEAYDTEYYSYAEIERIIIKGFECAMKRRKKLCLVDKANVLASSRLWRKVFDKVASDYPEVETSRMYVDNAAMQLACAPYKFDTVVTSNLFGDILSDEASVITGSIGLLPSASVGEVDIYEPIHGSAPDIAGKNIADPIGMILSVAMLFRYKLNVDAAADEIENAVSAVLEKGLRTADIYDNDSIDTKVKICTTTEIGDAILNELEQ
jgi:3-isopropylmalate dehydrogenase